MPNLEIVGLPDTSIREARERVKIAIKNSGIEFPNKHITVNLAPADTRKEGSGFDLAIAIGILSAIGIIENDNLHNFVILGELSLDGSIHSINGILPMCVEAQKLNIPNILIPYSNSYEASIVKKINIFPIKHLLQAISFFNGQEEILPITSPENLMLQSQNHFNIDFADVKGQSNVKRALEISAAGGHNCCMIGPPRLWKIHACTKITHYFTRFKFRRSFRNYKNSQYCRHIKFH